MSHHDQATPPWTSSKAFNFHLTLPCLQAAAIATKSFGTCSALSPRIDGSTLLPRPPNDLHLHLPRCQRHTLMGNSVSCGSSDPIELINQPAPSPATTLLSGCRHSYNVYRDMLCAATPKLGDVPLGCPTPWSATSLPPRFARFQNWLGPTYKIPETFFPNSYFQLGSPYFPNGPGPARRWSHTLG